MRLHEAIDLMNQTQKEVFIRKKFMRSDEYWELSPRCSMIVETHEGVTCSRVVNVTPTDLITDEWEIYTPRKKPKGLEIKLLESGCFEIFKTTSPNTPIVLRLDAGSWFFKKDMEWSLITCAEHLEKLFQERL